MRTVFMVRVRGNWDGEFEDTQLFESAEEAREVFEKEWDEQKEQYLDCYDEGDLIFDTSDDTRREIYQDGWYDTNHCIVSLEPVNIK
jgi:hypothetical protein